MSASRPATLADVRATTAARDEAARAELKARDERWHADLEARDERRRAELAAFDARAEARADACRKEYRAAIQAMMQTFAATLRAISSASPGRAVPASALLTESHPPLKSALGQPSTPPATTDAAPGINRTLCSMTTADDDDQHVGLSRAATLLASATAAMTPFELIFGKLYF